MAAIVLAEMTRDVVSTARVEGLHIVGDTSRVFDVLFTGGESILQQTVQSLTASGIPAYWEQHPFANFTFVTTKSERFINANMRRVTVFYTALENPFDQDPVISYTFAGTNEPIDRDIEGKRIQNVNGESFDPPINETSHDLVIRYNHNWGAYDPLLAADFQNAVNADIFFFDGKNFPAKTALIKDFSAERLRAGAIFYFNVSIEFHIRYDAEDDDNSTWARRIINEGFLEKVIDDEGGIASEATEIVDANGNKVSSPKALKEDGTVVPEGGEIHLLSFDTKPQRNFTLLGIA